MENQKLEKNPFPVKLYEGMTSKLRIESWETGRSINSLIRTAIQGRDSSVELTKRHAEILYDLLIKNMKTTPVKDPKFKELEELFVVFRAYVSK